MYHPVVITRWAMLPSGICNDLGGGIVTSGTRGDTVYLLKRRLISRGHHNFSLQKRNLCD